MQIWFLYGHTLFLLHLSSWLHYSRNIYTHWSQWIYFWSSNPWANVSNWISKLHFKWIADVSQEAVKVRSVRTPWGIIRQRTKTDVTLVLFFSKGGSLKLLYRVFIIYCDNYHVKGEIFCIKWKIRSVLLNKPAISQWEGAYGGHVVQFGWNLYNFIYKL